MPVSKLVFGRYWCYSYATVVIEVALGRGRVSMSGTAQHSIQARFSPSFLPRKARRPPFVERK
jgi:hypothetical protein